MNELTEQNQEQPQQNNACDTCAIYQAGQLKKLGLNVDNFDFVLALAGNPNTGKSTVFNRLTGLRQHTGNWPGKTVARAEGGMLYADNRYKIVDLPGTYSLLSTSYDEDVARDFILFARPDVTVVVVDASRLESNLNLVLQILEITDRVVICLNLMDEAERRELKVDDRRLARDLGVPVVPTTARYNEGMEQLIAAIHDVATGKTVCKPHRLRNELTSLNTVLPPLVKEIENAYPGLPNAHWVALRLLDGDARVFEAVSNGELGQLSESDTRRLAQSLEPGSNVTDEDTQEPVLRPEDERVLEQANQLRWKLSDNFHEHLVEGIFTEASRLAERAVTRPDQTARFDWDRSVDRIVTSRIWGFPLMFLLFATVFWLTISGANVPSSMLNDLLIGWGHPLLLSLGDALSFPWWLSGFLIDGVYLATAWVIAVMLPPMAIFFPCFTLLEDLGYLPRVAFNLDRMFRRSGAHGKQALSMMMGFGCNAAGVISTRVIDSPRERLIAIITNNFALCNGRWPTQILIATLFIGALVPSYLAGFVSALAVIGVAGLGIFLTFVTSWGLSRTVLRGEASSFSLELPPYRPPRILQTLYTSLIDRTLKVLWRAVVFAIPAGAAIWLFSNINIGDLSIAEHIIYGLDPVGLFIGLNGVILLAYVLAIPANEIVIPTLLMLTVLVAQINGVGEATTGQMFEPSSDNTLLILEAGGWTLLTAVNLMLFSLIHNPCSTTIYTIYKETGSAKWTAIATLLPVVMGLIVVFTVAQVWRIAEGFL